MLRWFARRLGKGQLCVGSASLTSLPQLFQSKSTWRGGGGREIGGLLLLSNRYSFTDGVAADQTSRAKGLQLRLAYLKTWWRSIRWDLRVTCKIPRDVQSKGWSGMCTKGKKKHLRSWCPGLRNVKCCDHLKYFLQLQTLRELQKSLTQHKLYKKVSLICRCSSLVKVWAFRHWSFSKNILWKSFSVFYVTDKMDKSFTAALTSDIFIVSESQNFLVFKILHYIE